MFRATIVSISLSLDFFPIIDQTCPERATELNNQIWSVVFLNNN